MHRKPLLNLLEKYSTNQRDEQSMLDNTIAFVKTYPNCFERTLAIGHITASVLITDEAHKNVLMTHHAKLNLWLQPGGHCDGDSDVKAVAVKEAQEETGLKHFSFKKETIFDIDVHNIPARKEIAQHLHYDIRFWLIADIEEPLIISSESKDLKWIEIEEVKNFNNHRSISRMIDKVYMKPRS